MSNEKADVQGTRSLWRSVGVYCAKYTRGLGVVVAKRSCTGHQSAVDRRPTQQDAPVDMPLSGRPVRKCVIAN